ncbi:MAG: hypothetical protein V1798_10745 [Pseudomonadota bacterium]
MVRLRTKASAGFGLVDLVVSLLVMSVLMAGLYKLSASSTRMTYVTTKSGKMSRDALGLRYRLEMAFRNMGLNETPVVYPICTGAAGTYSPDGYGTCDPSPATKQFGFRSVNFSELEYASDDPANTSSLGAVEAKEVRQIFMAKTPTSTHWDALNITDPNKDPCTPLSGNFSDTYNLYEAVGSDIQVLAQNVLCFEVRYFRDGDPDQAEQRWQPVCRADATGITNGSGITTGPCPSYTKPADLLTTSLAEYRRYELITKIRKVQVGFRVLGPQDPTLAGAGVPGPNVANVVFSANLANPPWMGWLYSSAL